MFVGGMLFAVNGPAGPNGAPVQGIIVDMETGNTLETFNNQQVRFSILKSIVLQAFISTRTGVIITCGNYY